MQFISLIIAIAKAVPVIDKWLERLMLAYLAYKADQLRKINKETVKDAIENRDQRPLESEQYSGKPSGHGNVVDSLPRMRDKKQD